MDAILLAGGGANPRDPLFALSQGLPKALLPIAGKPMAQRVLDALSGAASVDRIVVVGLEGKRGLSVPEGTEFLPDHGSLIENVRAGILACAGAEKLLVSSVDIPALEAAMVDWAIERTEETEDDFWYLVIDKREMEARFPGSGRSYLRFRDREICGGDFTILRAKAFSSETGIWRKLTEGRKSAFALAATIGFDVLLAFLFRRLSVEDAARKASARLGLRGRVLDCPFPEAGMDVDKPFQFKIVERFLEGRERV